MHYVKLNLICMKIVGENSLRTTDHKICIFS